MISVYYTQISGPLHKLLFDEYLQSLPPVFSAQILRYKKWEDAHASLFGKLLLKKGLIHFTGNPAALELVKLDQYKKPFLNAQISFNISHSGKYALCAFSTTSSIGIDIEEIRALNYSDFDRVFTAREFDRIHQSPDPLREFYNGWTQKEAVIKADSRGLGIPLHNVQLQKDIVLVDAQQWHIHPVDIDKDYVCHLASDRHEPAISLEAVNFYTC